MPLLTIQGRLGAPDAPSSLVGRGTWHIDGSQCGIGIRVSDHVMVMCVFITAVPITKLFAGEGGGGEWRTCATRDYEPRQV